MVVVAWSWITRVVVIFREDIGYVWMWMGILGEDGDGIVKESIGCFLFEKERLFLWRGIVRRWIGILRRGIGKYKR